MQETPPETPPETQPETQPRSRWDRRLGAALALLLALVALGPALLQADHALLGADMVDLHGTTWFYWMVDDALVHGRFLVHTDRIFFPWGTDLYRHTGINILDALAAVPFRHLLGAVAGTNTFWLGTLLGTFLAARRLARRVTSDPLAITVAAACLALAPAVLFDLGEGRPTQALLLLPVLFTGALWDTGRRPGWRAPVVAGLLLAATGYQYWFYAVFAGLGALGHGLAASLQPPPGAGRRREVLGRHALAAAVALAAVAPTALPLAADAAGGAVPGLLDTSRWSWAFQPTWTVQGEALSLFSWQPLGGGTGWLVLLPEGGQAFIPSVHLLPLAALPLALAGLVALRGARLRLLGLLLLPALLAIGPTLVLGHLALPNPVAMLLTEALPFLRRLWWPARGVDLLLVPGTMLLAAGLAAVRARGAAVGRLAALALVAATLVQLRLDGLAPVPSWDPQPPAGYRCLAKGPEGAVLELPWGGSQRGLAWQSAHGRPLLGGLAEGNGTLVPLHTQELLRDDPWLDKVVYLASDGTAPRSPHRPRPRRTRLPELGVSYVVLRRDELPPDSRRDSSLIQVLGQPLYRDARTWIFGPWGAPYPCPGVALAADTVPQPPLVPPRSERTSDSPWAVHLRYPLLAGPPPAAEGLKRKR